jgi:hypothetical protein
VSGAERGISRNLVVQRWGTPERTIGSLNEPRESEEHGVWFNERWIYRLPQHGGADPRKRIVYWLRYDFVASVLVTADGRVVREDLRAVLAGLDDRRWRPSAADARR